MSVEALASERSVVLVKALPQPSEGHGETVCVAGLTPTGEWRRLYPIRFRHLDDKFRRWEWIEYRARSPRKDRRIESRNVEEDSIKTIGKMPPSERPDFLGLRVRQSTDEAARRGESLTILRPSQTNFFWELKTQEEVASDRAEYESAANQLSILDKELKALEPCPYKFYFRYCTADGKSHLNFCHDWETSAAFHNLSKRYGSQRALAHLREMYNNRYPSAGMVFAMGTHSQRPDQWLLVGVIRLDDEKQGQLDV
jgi:hypothetical protein